MSARSPFLVKPAPHYSNGVLFYKNTTNKFSFVDFFSYTTTPQNPFELAPNTRLFISIPNKPTNFNQVGTSHTYTFDYPEQTSSNGYIMNVNFTYEVAQEPFSPGDPFIVATRLNAQTKLKIFVQ